MNTLPGTGITTSDREFTNYTITRIKSKTAALRGRMTKAEEFDKARRLAYKGDLSLVHEIYDPDCKHFDHRFGMEVNLDMQSAVMSAYENSTFGPYRVIYENEEFLCIHRYMRKQQQREPVYWTLISGVNYRNGKVIRHETAIEELDYDPSENQDWNWEDYE